MDTKTTTSIGSSNPVRGAAMVARQQIGGSIELDDLDDYESTFQPEDCLEAVEFAENFLKGSIEFKNEGGTVFFSGKTEEVSITETADTKEQFHNEPRDIEIPRENQKQIFTVGLESLAEKTAGLTESIGQILPGALNDGKDALTDLWTNHLNISGTKKESTKTEQEDQLNKAVFVKQTEAMQQTEKAIENLSQERFIKEVCYSAGDDAAALSEEEINKSIKVQEGYRRNGTKMTLREAVEVRNALKTQKQALENKEKKQSIAVTQQAVNMNGAMEGGTGGAKANISATGGGAG